MISWVFDAGALIAIERGDRAFVAELLVARKRGIARRTNAVVLGQVWRGGTTSQVQLARALRSVEIRDVTEADGREAGSLLGASGTSDVVDASLVLIAHNGDVIATSDPEDIRRLAAALDVSVKIRQV